MARNVTLDTLLPLYGVMSIENIATYFQVTQNALLRRMKILGQYMWKDPTHGVILACGRPDVDLDVYLLGPPPVGTRALNLMETQTWDEVINEIAHRIGLPRSAILIHHIRNRKAVPVTGQGDWYEVVRLKRFFGQAGKDVVSLRATAVAPLVVEDQLHIPPRPHGHPNP